ncbi:unnamed protein product [Ectocarpus sp. CCAP 1310/34]|nr:unnamed protein product [Ectocarpus sp. CCAP 1310/34]
MMRGDNVSAVSWVNRCGGSSDRRAGLLMRLLGRMEIETDGVTWRNTSRDARIPSRTGYLDGSQRT